MRTRSSAQRRRDLHIPHGIQKLFLGGALDRKLGKEF
jgi:hypothetical protein